MKTKIKKLAFGAVVTLALVAFLQLGKSKAEVLIPIEGCRYTENIHDYCKVGGPEEGYLIIIYCSNYIGVSDCGIEIEIEEPQ